MADLEQRLLGDTGTLPDGRPFSVFEYLSGPSLARHLEEVGKLSIAQAVVTVDQVCAALGHAHMQGVIHRDLKPSNIFLSAAPDDRTDVTLLDFGIAKCLRQTGHLLALTAAGQLLGTPSYMSYEQARGDSDIDKRTDIWNVGAVLYELLTGVRAFERSNFTATMASIVSERPKPMEYYGAVVPKKLADVTFRCLSWERDARFQSMEELREALADAMTCLDRLEGHSATSALSTQTPSVAVDADPRSRDSVAPHCQTVNTPVTKEMPTQYRRSALRRGFAAVLGAAAALRP